MFNPNLILNAASELNLSIKTSGDLSKIIMKLEEFKPKNNKNFLQLSEKENQELKKTQFDLNQLKKVKMIIKIVKLGVNVSSFDDLSELKEKKIENLIKIDPFVFSKVQENLLIIDNQKKNLKI